MKVSTHKGYKKNLKPNMFRIIVHSLLFGMQSIVFTMPNAIYTEIFLEVGIIKEAETNQTSRIVGYLTGSFFLGKLISDPIWGVVRDQLGDKKSLTLITFLLFLTLLAFGLCKSLVQLCIAISFIGLASGVYVPGTAFINWIEPSNRDFLAMWIYIFAGAGALIGPFAGSTLFATMPSPKLFTTWGIIGLLMLVLTGLFLWAFKDFDDKALIEASNYSKMEEEEMRSLDLDDIQIRDEDEDRDLAIKSGMLKNSKSMQVDEDENYLSSGDEDKRMDPVFNYRRSLKHPRGSKPTSTYQETNNPKVRFDIEALMEKEKEQEQLRSTNLKLIQSRRRVSKMTATEMMKKDSVRRNLIFIGAISWGVKVIDWMLLAIWLETNKEKGGMGFTSMETGTVSLLSFPCVSLCILACYRVISKGLQTNWLIGTVLTTYSMCLLIPLINLCYFEHETLILMIIFINSVKEGSYLIWVSTWSQLMSKMFPSMLLGRVYSWSYFLGHVILLISSQVYPRGLTYFMDSPKIESSLGKFKYFFFFLLLGLPLAGSAILTSRIKTVSYQKEKLNI